MDINNNSTPSSPVDETKNYADEINNIYSGGIPQPTAPVVVEKRGGRINVLIIAVLISFLVLVGVGVWGFITYGKEKETLKQGCSDEVNNILDLEAQYESMVTHIKNSDFSSGTGSRGTNVSVLGAEDIRFGDEVGIDMSQVLGLEDTPEIKHTREFIEMLRNALSTLDDIEEKNISVEDSVKGFMILGKLTSDPALPIDSTKTFVEKTRPLLTYMKDMESFSIKSVSPVYDFIASVNEALMRGADADSVANMEDKYNALKDLKSEAERIDVSGISPELREDHEKGIESFDKDMKVFADIYNAIKDKDIVALRKSLISGMSQGDAATQTSTTEYVTFWQEDETLRSVSTVREEWEKAKDSLSN